MNSPNPPTEKRPPLPPRLYRVFGAILGPVEKALGISCRDFTQLASAKLDQPLSAGEHCRYFLHRLICDICRRQEKRLRQLNRLASATLKQAGDDAMVKLDDEARERIRKRILEELRNGSKPGL